MSSEPSTWSVVGTQWHSLPDQNPSAQKPPQPIGNDDRRHVIPQCETISLLSRTSGNDNGQQHQLSLTLIFSTYDSSPYTYHGTAKYTQKAGLRIPGGEEAEFRLRGEGTVMYRVDGIQVFDSRCRIVEGSGRGEFEGVRGCGRLCTEVRKHRSEWFELGSYPLFVGREWGWAVWEGVGDVGGVLL
ncbi:MAG: hypothetical protein Q9169_007053 [Polycauliona sp. 2 TL-2023]